MTEPHHEPSYYEIALTNRQVVVAFVILLVCLLAAFFSGVWIGRGGIDMRKDQVVRASPPATQTASQEGRTLEELKFFADRQTKKGEKTQKSEEKPVEVAQAPSPAPEEKPAPPPPTTAPPASAPAQNTTLQQDIGQPRQNPAAKPHSAVRSTPPAPAPVETAAEEPAPRPSAADRSSDRASRTADTATGSSASTGGASAGSVVIQVFASADQAEANRVRDRLTKGGQAAFLSPLTVDGRTMYRVRIGPFASRPKAQQVAEKVRKTYKLDTWLTQ